jgi:hypothetical protein
VIAEVDETIPALKKGTVTIIDDRQPDQSDEVSFSNFSVNENRETHDIELWVTPIGAKARHKDSPSDHWESDSYKYTLTIA